MNRRPVGFLDLDGTVRATRNFVYPRAHQFFPVPGNKRKADGTSPAWVSPRRDYEPGRHCNRRHYGGGSSGCSRTDSGTSRRSRIGLRGLSPVRITFKPTAGTAIVKSRPPGLRLTCSCSSGRQSTWWLCSRRRSSSGCWRSAELVATFRRSA